MNVDVVTEIVLDRPLAEVVAYAADPSNAPQWYANIESVEWETPPAAMRRANTKDLQAIKAILEA